MVEQKKLIGVKRQSAKHQSAKHQFAFYIPAVFEFVQSIQLKGNLTQPELIHRISRVVKVSVGETVVLFDQQYHAVVKLLKITKREISIQLLSHQKNKTLQPHVTFLLPLLKRDALEDSIYSLAEMGVNEIQLVVTEKSRAKLTEKDLQRLQKIVVAAAEQSKHFAFPQIHVPQELKNYVTNLSENDFKVVFDVSGASFFDMRNNIKSNVYLAVGPEGSFSSQELQLLQAQGFISCALTQTILRSLQAVAVGTALFRL